MLALVGVELRLVERTAAALEGAAAPALGGLLAPLEPSAGTGLDASTRGKRFLVPSDPTTSSPSLATPLRLEKGRTPARLLPSPAAAAAAAAAGAAAGAEPRTSGGGVFALVLPLVAGTAAAGTTLAARGLLGLPGGLAAFSCCGEIIILLLVELVFALLLLLLLVPSFLESVVPPTTRGLFLSPAGAGDLAAPTRDGCAVAAAAANPFANPLGFLPAPPPLLPLVVAPPPNSAFPFPDSVVLPRPELTSSTSIQSPGGVGGRSTSADDGVTGALRSLDVGVAVRGEVV
ncbi:unnamed protein product, partial [Ectocarpus sp. 13 AM-2016]